MPEITEDQYDKIKKEALGIFRKNKRIQCPAFGGVEIKITPNGFNHLEWKKTNHRRSLKEGFMRYLCFKHVKYILNNLKLYQEYKEELKEFYIKRKGKKVKVRKIVEYFGFVSIVNENKNRVKIVISKTDGWKGYEFVSVVPYWNTDGYNKLFYEEKEQ